MQWTATRREGRSLTPVNLTRCAARWQFNGSQTPQHSRFTVDSGPASGHHGLYVYSCTDQPVLVVAVQRANSSTDTASQVYPECPTFTPYIFTHISTWEPVTCPCRHQVHVSVSALCHPATPAFSRSSLSHSSLSTTCKSSPTCTLRSPVQISVQATLSKLVTYCVLLCCHTNSPSCPEQNDK